MPSLAARRDFFARLVTAASPSADPRLQAAFRATPREHFLGRGPWHAFTTRGYLDIPADDPSLLYQDITIALDRQAGINNGQPSLHAFCLAALAPQPGELALHIGAGAGYYTAILAQLVGPGGRVDAYECLPDLARRAAENLAPYPNAVVHAENAAVGELPRCNLIYVNAGATAPLESWLRALLPAGRLLFPLTGDSGAGAMLLITRGGEGQPWPARFLMAVAFVGCAGGRTAEEGRELDDAFAGGRARAVRWLHRGTPPPDACISGRGWWLSGPD